MCEDTWENYESGPFCRHWGDPSDCDTECANCHHTCSQHYANDNDCRECDCSLWGDTDDPTTLKARAEEAFGNNC